MIVNFDISWAEGKKSIQHHFILISKSLGAT